jgi:CBS domain containing-hemolysin-like protein
MSTLLIMVAVVVLMIALTALYVGAEFAAVSARRTRIGQMATAGDGLARMLEPIMADPHRLDNYIAACQLGITATSLVLGFYGQSAIATALAPLLSSLGGLREAAAQSIAATVVLIGLTVFTVVLGELVPKSVALRYPERLALLTVLPLRWSMILFRPAIALFNGAGGLILRLLGVPAAGSHMHVHSPEEIDLLVAESAKGGLLDSDERQLLHNAFRVGALTAAEVMVPRTRLVAASVETSLDDLLELTCETGFSRIPLYRETIDQIIGIVHVKDLFRLHVAGQGDVGSILRAAPFVPETTPAVDIWNRLRGEGSYVAIVFDEYGGTAGMITIEDLIEELFGELHEEYGEEPALIAAGPDGCVRLHGQVRIDDVNERFGLGLPAEKVTTIGGLVLAQLGRPARVDDQVQVAGATMRVETVSGNTIREVTLCPPDGRTIQAAGAEGARHD